MKGEGMQIEEAAGLDTRELRVGVMVEVRSADEILATLDENGELDSLPFMPEMLLYCGRRLTVYRSAHKLCDTQTMSGMRRMPDAVHLTDARCDGQAHGGCQAACLMYWKSAWLKRIDSPMPPRHAAEPPAWLERTGAPGPPQHAAEPPNGVRLLPVISAASRGPRADDGAETFRCQATEILRAAPAVLPIRNLAQYLQDVRTGNVGVWWALRAFLVAVFNRVQDISSRKLPPWLRFRGGLRWGFLKGTAARTPTGQTNLRPGELVRVKSKDDIVRTLNVDLLNRGMGFDIEMARYCGRTARVARRIDRIINEKTGRMIHMRNPCIVLEGIICEGAFSVNCPRAITSYWREIWLERVGDGDTA